MRKINKYASVIAGFIGGAAFIVGCGNESVVSAAESLWNNVGSTLYYTGGNVGIGTDSPTSELEISGSNNRARIRLSGSKVYQIGSSSSLDGTPSSLTFKDIDNNIDRMVIDENGNVGIGVLTPNSKLAIAGLPTSAPDTSGNAGVVCSTNDGNLWLDNDGTADCQ